MDSDSTSNSKRIAPASTLIQQFPNRTYSVASFYSHASVLTKQIISESLDSNRLEKLFEIMQFI